MKKLFLVVILNLMYIGVLNAQNNKISIIGSFDRNDADIMVRAQFDKDLIKRSENYERIQLVAPDSKNIYAFRGFKQSFAVLSANLTDNKVIIRKFPETDDIKKLKFVGSTFFQGRILVFFEGISEQVKKKHSGLFMSAYDMKSHEFGKLKLISQIKSSMEGGYDNMIIQQSEDGKFIGIITNPVVNCSMYSFCTVVINESLLVEYEHVLTDEVDHCSDFRNANITNSGELFIFFSGSAKFSTVTKFPDPFENALYVVVDKSGKKNDVTISLEDKNLLEITLLGIENGYPSFFVSWVNDKDDSIEGISILSGESLKEEILIQFEASYLEPFISEGIKTYVDIDKKRGSPSKNGNFLLSLEKVVEYNNYKYVFLEKRVPIIIKLPPSVVNITINTVYSGNFGKNIYTSYNSDIIILKLKDNKLVSKQKLERGILGELYSNKITYHVSNNLVKVLYYSKYKEELSENVRYLMDENFALYQSVVNLDNAEITTEIILDLPKKKSNQNFNIELGQLPTFDNNLYSIGKLNDSLHFVKIDLND